MSLDLYMRGIPCKECGHYAEKNFDLNYTYNVAPMWYKIYPDDKGMVEIEGMTGREAYVKLVNASKAMQKNPEEFKKLNPPNGWGNYESFLEFIHQCIWASLSNPEMIWQASR